MIFVNTDILHKIHIHKPRPELHICAWTNHQRTHYDARMRRLLSLVNSLL